VRKRLRARSRLILAPPLAVILTLTLSIQLIAPYVLDSSIPFVASDSKVTMDEEEPNKSQDNSPKSESLYKVKLEIISPKNGTRLLTSIEGCLHNPLEIIFKVTNIGDTTLTLNSTFILSLIVQTPEDGGIYIWHKENLQLEPDKSYEEHVVYAGIDCFGTGKRELVLELERYEGTHNGVPVWRTIMKSTPISLYFESKWGEIKPMIEKTTMLRVIPSSFLISPGESIHLHANLIVVREDISAIQGKEKEFKINWDVKRGKLSSKTSTSGESIIYYAPNYETIDVVTASFPDYNGYQGSKYTVFIKVVKEIKKIEIETEWWETVKPEIPHFVITIFNKGNNEFKITKVVLSGIEVWKGEFIVEANSRKELMIDDISEVFKLGLVNNLNEVYIENSVEQPAYYHNIVILCDSTRAYSEGHTKVFSFLRLYHPEKEVEINKIIVKRETYGAGQSQDLDLEEEYLPVVVACEIGGEITSLKKEEALEVLKTQVIVSRTYALYIQKNKGFLYDDERSQVYNSQHPNVQNPKIMELIYEAIRETRGIVLKYRGEIICAFFVSGKGKYETYVTNNEGKVGDDVKPVGWPIGSTTNPLNRGCMGQIQAIQWAKTGYGFEKILKHFYGDDIEIISK
jgi:hypothetical protein